MSLSDKHLRGTLNNEGRVSSGC